MAREETAAEKLLADFERLGFQLEDKQQNAGMATSAASVGAKAVIAALVASLKAASRSQRLLKRAGSMAQNFVSGANATRRAFKLATKAFIAIDAVFVVADTAPLIAEWAGKNPTVEDINTVIHAFKYVDN